MLGLWMYSWDLVDWQPAEPDPPALPEEQPEARRSNEGGGHYQSLGDDYWMAREQALTNEMPEAQPPIKVVEYGPSEATLRADAKAAGLNRQIGELEQQLQTVLMQTGSAADPMQKMQLAGAAVQLSLDISKLREQYYERARNIRLLDIY